MSRRWAPVAVAVAGLAGSLGLTACDTGDGRTLEPPPPGATAPPQPDETTSSSAGAVLGQPPAGSSDEGALVLGSAAFTDGAPIPPDHACDGANVSPPLYWSAVPAVTVELGLTVVDLDTPETQLVHWAVAGLDPTLAGLDAGVDIVAIGGIEARNYTTEFGWAGPCPPEGEVHRYVFTLYALTEPSGVGPGATGDDVVAALATTPGAAAVLTGTYPG